MNDFAQWWWSSLIALAVVGASTLYALQPDVGLEANLDVTLGVGAGLFYEVLEDGGVVASKGPVRPTHLFERIVKARGVKTYIYLRGHYGTYLRYNRETKNIEATGDPSVLGGFNLDPELAFVEWRLGRISHPWAENARVPRKTASKSRRSTKTVAAKALTVGHLEEKGVMEGDVHIRTERDLKKLFGFQRIRGSVTIEGTLLSELDSLSTLRRIDGDLRITGNAGLTSLHGLKRLTRVGGQVEISNNPALGSVAGTAALTLIGGTLSISDNEQLSDLSGLGPLQLVGDFEIRDNPQLAPCEEDRLFERPGLEQHELRVLAHRLRHYGPAYRRACTEVVGEETMQLLELIVRSEDIRRLDLRRWAAQKAKLTAEARRVWREKLWSVGAVKRFGQLGVAVGRAEMKDGRSARKRARWAKRMQPRGPGETSLGELMDAPVGQMPWDILQGEGKAEGKAAGKRGRRGKKMREGRQSASGGSSQGTDQGQFFEAGPESISFGDQLIESEPILQTMKVVGTGQGSGKPKEKVIKKKRSVYVFVLESLTRRGHYRVEYGHDPIARLRQHNQRKVLTTAHLRPWKIRHQLRFSSERKAKRFVRYLQLGAEAGKSNRVARTGTSPNKAGGAR